jgi:hypothetical protein
MKELRKEIERLKAEVQHLKRMLEETEKNGGSLKI